MLARKALAGTAGAPKEYVEDVFSTYLYTGSGSPKTITNDIDLSGEGGMVWIKQRGNATDHAIVDTARGAQKNLRPHQTVAEFTEDTVSSFTSSGFTLTQTTYPNNDVNGSSLNYASWTFRKAKKFFDVVTFTAASSGNTTVSHNLGSTPGFVIVKRTDNTSNWITYHRSYTSTNYYQYLNSTAAQTDFGSAWITTSSTNCVFDSTVLNASASYVMYVFAHDAGGFGDAGSDSIIKCGSYTGNGSTTGPTVTLDWEPQWLMIKNTSGTGGWIMFDNMRGFTVASGGDPYLFANTSAAEVDLGLVYPTATGFGLSDNSSAINTNGSTYVYIAIRRGPMKTPTSGTSVFTSVAKTGVEGAIQTNTTNFVADLSIDEGRASNYGALWFDRLRGKGPYLISSSTAAEGNQDPTYYIGFDSNTSVFNKDYGSITGTYINWLFSRAPGFFDVVCYTGTGSATTFNHNLGVAPEMIIVKMRNSASDWVCYHKDLGNTYTIFPNGNYAKDGPSGVWWNSTTPTSSVFSVGTNSTVNASTYTYVAYLFASVSGVSKVGSYTGNGSSQTINCNFTAGARFILIKRTDSTGDWYVYDSARGIVSGNDPQLKLNSTASEATGYDAIDPDNSGFIVNNDATNFPINVNNATYIYLAIA